MLLNQYIAPGVRGMQMFYDAYFFPETRSWHFCLIKMSCPFFNEIFFSNWSIFCCRLKPDKMLSELETMLSLRDE